MVLPRSGPSQPSSFTCGNIRLVEHSSISTFTAYSFRDSRDIDSDDSSPPRSWRSHTATSPRASPLLPDFGPIILPDLEPLHRSIDELTLCPSADELDVDADSAPRG